MKRVLIAALLVLVAVALPASQAAAGGWAVSSLDEVPVPQAGQPLEVGWTVRQHGVRPVNLEEGDVGVVVRSPSGAERFFPAEQEGPVGHYVARVVFPEAGSSTWSIRQGPFAEQELGTLTVAESGAAMSRPGAVSSEEPMATATAAPAGGSRGPVLVRYGFPALAALLVAAALVDVVRFRRRASAATA
jgi:hypothetical protein